MATPPGPGEFAPPSEGGRFAHPPLHRNDALDGDTGPLYVTRTNDRTYRPPARLEDAYADRFSTPLAVEPRIRRQRLQPTVLAAAVAGLAVVGVVGWLLWPSSGATAAVPPPVDVKAQLRLAALLPAGYSADACTPIEAPKGAVAAVNCTQNADAGGPPSATYSLMKDDAALSAAVGAAIKGAALVECPGNIQSPGPWRRNATPRQIAGTLVCELPQGQPQVVWTNDAQLVLNVVRAGPEGPTLDQLYAWWSNHS